MLRLQRERMERALLPTEQEFFHQYGLTEERLALAKPDAIVMHPGPINRGVEIDSRVADGPRSVILEQVTSNASPCRMAIMSITLGNHARPLGEDAFDACCHRGRRVIDPAHQTDGRRSFIADGRIAGSGQPPAGFAPTDGSTLAVRSSVLV